MFKIGTLVPTNRGVIPIEQFGFTRKENERTNCINNIMLKTYDGEWNKCIFHTYKRSKGIKIKLSSRFLLECTGDQKILTPEGLKRADELKTKDEICTYTDVYVGKSAYFTETEKIGYIPKEGNDIYIPKKMTESLAFVCGVLSCPSTEIRLNADDKLVVVCKDRIISKIFIRFIRDLFQTKQKVVVQDDNYLFLIASLCQRKQMHLAVKILLIYTKWFLLKLLLKLNLCYIYMDIIHFLRMFLVKKLFVLENQWLIFFLIKC